MPANGSPDRGKVPSDEPVPQPVSQPSQPCPECGGADVACFVMGGDEYQYTCRSCAARWWHDGEIMMPLFPA